MIFSVTWHGEKGNLDDFYSLPIEEKNNIRLVRGHFDYGIHNHFNQESEYFTFLRKSEERLMSFYNYVKRRPENRLFDLVNEKNMSFEEFIMLNDKDGNNGQVRKLSGIDGDEKIMLKTAIKNIETHFPVVGLQEYFDESLLVLAHHYGWSLPFYIKQNVSKKKKNVSNKEKKLIELHNQGDIALYSYIENRLRQQSKNVPFFTSKLLMLRLTNFLLSNPIAIRIFKTRKLLKLEQ
ncbi:MAG: hypothetical protein ACJ04Q_08725 [Flavobacteriales bacterium]